MPSEPYSPETHADWDGLLTPKQPERGFIATYPTDCRLSISDRRMYLSGPPQSLLDWLDRLTAEVGVAAHDTGAEAVWFTFDNAAQTVVVTLKGATP